jgi:lipopolysaccharide/colanic/teichoic acid biosynthesis glycosyltransferase
MKIKLTKRIFDIFISILLGVLLSPLLLIIYIAISLESGSPVFYKSKRYVSKDKCITIYKFRSMVKNAHDFNDRLYSEYFDGKYLDIPLSDPVYTKTGVFIEKYQLVEIPQLLNIIKGDISFVGNRPLPIRNIEKHLDDPVFMSRFNSPAGLTGLSQLVGRSDKSAQRAELESHYSFVYNNKKVLLWVDIQIIYFTFVKIFLGRKFSASKLKLLIN